MMKVGVVDPICARGDHRLTCVNLIKLQPKWKASRRTRQVGGETNVEEVDDHEEVIGKNNNDDEGNIGLEDE